MRGQQPKIRQKKNGAYFVRWAGTDHYLSRDSATAEKMFFDKAGAHPGALVNWVAWKERTSNAARAATERIRIAELAKRFLGDYYAQARVDAERYYRLSLRRFLHTFGRFHADQFDLAGYDAFRTTLINLRIKRGGIEHKLSPRTIRHECKAVATMFRWGAERRMCPAIDFRVIRLPRVPRALPEPMTLQEIHDALALVRARMPALEPWLALNYLCALRPSEVARIARGEARVRNLPGSPHVALELRHHKTEESTEQSRYVPLSDEALQWLPHVRPLSQLVKSQRLPTLKSASNFYAKCARQCGVPGMPHRLRDSAATHLLEAGVEQGTVDLCLGHAPRGELASYARPGLEVLRDRLALLTLTRADPRQPLKS